MSEAFEVKRGLVKRGRPSSKNPNTEMFTLEEPIVFEDGNINDDNIDIDLDIDKPAPVLSSGSSPRVTKKQAVEIARVEEIEAQLAKETGRFIEHVDNAKVGVPFRQNDSNNPNSPMLDGVEIPFAQTFVRPMINDYAIRSDGFSSEGGKIFDPGEGAAAPQPVIDSANPHDPSSKEFIVCANKMCQYREGCLRYRMSNKRTNKFPFHPSECRKDGIYISINDTKFTGFDPFSVVEPSSNVMSLPSV
jgi:hypothetical protein